MTDKNSMTKNITIKTETAAKRVIIPSSLIASSAIKKEHSSRLQSFKPPRDLLLTGSTTGQATPILKDYISCANKANKRKYTPNVNVFRRKGTNNAQPSDSSSERDTKNKTIEQSKKGSVTNKKRNTNFIQTKGVFSEGLAPGKVKAFNSSYSERNYNESSFLEKPKLVLNQKINKNNEDAKLQSILKDDFIDDSNNLPDLNFMPNSLPTVYNAKDKYFNSQDVEKTFQNLQVKIEKVASAQNEGNKDYKSEVFHAFEENDSPKLLLFEFPKILHGLEEIEDKKRVSKLQPGSEIENRTKTGSLSSVGEGHWGSLRIHESGNAYFVVGSTVIPISLSRHITRQEVVSTKVDQSCCRGEVINLGTVDASFTCSTSFDDIS